MKKTVLMISLMLSLWLGVAAVSIYDIQFATSPGVDSSYPSPYLGREVTVEGVVTAINFRNGGYFISEPVSGAWCGILINDRRNEPQPGDQIRLTGKVAELFGMTCIQDISAWRIVARNRPLPVPVIITTGQLSRADEAEAYEGVYVRVLNASSSSARARNGKFMINDGSGQCSVSMGSFTDKKTLSPAPGVLFSQIVGVVVFGFGEFSLNPISSSDIQVQQPTSVQNRSWGKIKSIYK